MTSEGSKGAWHEVLQVSYHYPLSTTQRGAADVAEVAIKKTKEKDDGLLILLKTSRHITVRYR